MSAELKIARGLGLPLDVAGEAIAILAKRGAGKTNTARVLVEELRAADVQTVVLDPVGAWWGLRSSADGKGEGLAMAILGGAHGDVPLEPTAGKLLADVVVDAAESLVLDLSDFSKTQQRQFVTDFAERLYTRKARERTLLHLVLEEADEFAPQRVMAAAARMTGAIDQLVRRGRARGIGLTMITQRSAVLNKDVLTQADVLIAMRTTSPQDRKAIEEWVAKQAVDASDVVPSLPGLSNGEAWVWNPERDLLKRVQVRLARTFDAGATPKAGEARTAPKKTAAIDLTALGAEIQATAERAKENDPAELRKRVRELEREIAQRPAETQTVEVEKVVEVPTPVFNGEVEQLEQAVVFLGRVAEGVAGAADRLAQSADKIGEAGAAVAAAVATATGARVTTPPGRGSQGHSSAPPHAPTRSPAPRRERATPSVEPLPDGDVALSSSQQRILNALAWFEWIGIPAPARPALAFIAGSRPTSGGFKNNLGALRSAGLIDYPQGSRVQLLDPGRAIANAPSGEPTDELLQDAVLAAVTGSQAAIVRALIAAYPKPLPRDELADQVGVPTTSGGFKNNLGALRTLELIDYPQPGYVAALPVLFPVSEGDQ